MISFHLLLHLACNNNIDSNTSPPRADWSKIWHQCSGYGCVFGVWSVMGEGFTSFPRVTNFGFQINAQRTRLTGNW